MWGHVSRLILPAILISVAAPAFAETPEWEEITDEEGIKVWQREVEGTSLVEFRGRAMVDAPMKMLIAVLRDQKRKTEWLQNCMANAALHYYSTTHLVVYNRVKSPAFFISDRDVVLDVKATIDLPQKSLTLNFVNATHAKMPPVDGAVRMPNLKGYWKLVYKGPNRTEVTYQVQADPGGALPKWLVNWASKGIPFNTLKRLREQVKKPGYDDDLMIVEASFDWASVEAAEAAAAAGQAAPAAPPAPPAPLAPPAPSAPAPAASAGAP